MLKNYFKIAWRNAIRNRSFTLINILGLAVGLASCLVIGMYVWDQLSYDSFHANKDRVYRVVSISGDDGKVSHQMPPVLGPTMEQYFSSVDNTVRIWNRNSASVARPGEEKITQDDGFIYVDDSFFQLFTFELLQGNPQKVLSNPFSVVITDESAQKYFPGQNPIGKQLVFNDDQTLTVTGVVEDPPSNSSIQFNFLASFSSLLHPEEGIWMAREAGWRTKAFETYVLLGNNQSIGNVRERFRDYLTSQTDIEFILEDSYEFEPLSSLHLTSVAKNGVAEIGDLRYVYIFSSIAMLILFIAGINYVNLATANSVKRAREVGIRKASGANTAGLIQQFLGESVVITSLAFILAVIIVELIFPVLENLFNIQLSFTLLHNLSFLAAVFGISILVGILAGIYPALFLSRFKPIKVLRETFTPGSGRSILRKSLVTLQVIAFSGLISCTYIIYMQMQYVQEKNLGLETEQRFTVLIKDSYVYNRSNALKNEIRQLSGVQHASVSKSVPTKGNSRYTIKPEGSDSEIWVTNYQVDEDFVQTLGLKIVEGRDFINTTGKVRSALINEKARKVLGWDNPIGRLLPKKNTIENENGEKVEISYRVTGVVKDFHYQSLKKEIEPVFLLPPVDGNGFYLTVNTTADEVENLLGSIGNIWDSFSQKYPFEYFFLDEAFARLYEREQRVARLFNIFTVIGLIIGGLGLFSLSAYTAHRRIKEIGIRKVLGATSTSIVRNL